MTTLQEQAVRMIQDMSDDNVGCDARLSLSRTAWKTGFKVSSSVRLHLLYCGGQILFQ